MIGQSIKKSSFFPLSWLNISETHLKLEVSGCPRLTIAFHFSDAVTSVINAGKVWCAEKKKINTSIKTILLDVAEAY